MFIVRLNCSFILLNNGLDCLYRKNITPKVLTYKATETGIKSENLQKIRAEGKLRETLLKCYNLSLSFFLKSFPKIHRQLSERN